MNMIVCVKQVIDPEAPPASFKVDAASNKVVWEIKVSGEINKWPDVEQNFPITIHPLRIEDV